MDRQFELRQGDKVLARLTVSQTGEATLSHDLNEYQLQMLPVVLLFESDAELKPYNRETTVSFSDNTGAVRLSFSVDEHRVLNVRDTKGLALLRTILAGPGPIGNEPITGGSLVLRLEPKTK